MRTLAALLAAALAACSFSTPAASVDLRVLDRQTGRELPVYQHDGRRYVAGEPGHAYEIRLRNHSGDRLLAVTSVDGVNVLSGQTAAPDQSGYVLDPQASTRIQGWRKSLAEVAAFTFTALPDAYAARTGRPDNVGVIGVAVFRERERRRWQPLARPEADAESAPAAPAGKAAEAADAAGARQILGTGHGARIGSAAHQVEFERASQRPDAVLRLYYDARENLIARGVIPPPPLARRDPEPFPADGFVPDP